MVDTREGGRGWSRTWPPKIIAERGAYWHAPENSLRAIRGAVAAGADAIAIDVMRCGTGELVVCYERTLVKFAAGRWDDVAETPLDTLQSFDLGDGERIPVLADALAAIPADRLIDVRLRGMHRTSAVRERLADLVMAVTARARALDRLLVSSEDGATLAPFAEVGVSTALLMPSMPARTVDPARISPSVLQLEMRSVGVSVMRHWRAQNIAVHVGPANTRNEIALAWSLGVDGVLTNDPAGARNTFDQLQRRAHASGG